MRTVGVEEELLLLDPATGAPVARAADVLRRVAAEDAAARSVAGGNVEAELQQQQVEIDTTPQSDLDAVERELRAARARVDALGRAAGVRVAPLATSPLAVTPEVTPKSRYAAMVEHFGLTTAEQLTCGCHVHVEVSSREEGVAALDRVRVWLPVLLALSAGSPFWQGQDSGFASYRYQAWGRFPGAGPAPVLGSAAAYDAFVGTSVASGVLVDHAMVYLDARLSQRYPTLEVRIADVCPRVEDAVLIAALCRALVDTAIRSWTHHAPAPDVGSELVRLASWRASRSGLAGDLVDPLTHRPRRAADVVRSLLDHVHDALAEAGDVDRVEAGWAALRERGTGAARQRAWAEQDGDLGRVALRVADELLV
ncbi:carboxylate-amine ligase [Microlunatus flavus]|uniref:Putative glutamate--cysteine ligase 2 n=1 Tax=Microlunatus flavus TaxID=1036181 RepID=A0A1H9N3K5_9ACTN|nr:glutamate--cysteine ligase [Microlunatus flavus]SER30225.1 carboxylate-amine ligase [Microlunatus flavus]